MKRNVNYFGWNGVQLVRKNRCWLRDSVCVFVLWVYGKRTQEKKNGEKRDVNQSEQREFIKPNEKVIL